MFRNTVELPRKDTRENSRTKHRGTRNITGFRDRSLTSTSGTDDSLSVLEV